MLADEVACAHDVDYLISGSSLQALREQTASYLE